MNNERETIQLENERRQRNKDILLRFMEQAGIIPAAALYGLEPTEIDSLRTIVLESGEMSADIFDETIRIFFRKPEKRPLATSAPKGHTKAKPTLEQIEKNMK